MGNIPLFFSWFIVATVATIIWSILIGVLVPIVAATLFAKKRYDTNSKLSRKNLLLICLIFIALVAVLNLLWEGLVVKKLYYEWDSLMFPTTTFIGFDEPALVGDGSWIRSGWSVAGLRAVWFALLTSLLTICTLIVKKLSKSIEFKSVFTKTAIFIAMCSLVFAVFPITTVVYDLPAILLQTVNPVGFGNLVKNDPTPCTKAPNDAEILYQKNFEFSTSKMDGSGVQKTQSISPEGLSNVFSSNAPERHRVSPDGLRFLTTLRLGDDLYIYTRCIYSAGMSTSKFHLPQDNAFPVVNQPIRDPEWLADGKSVFLSYKNIIYRLELQTQKKDVIADDVLFIDNKLDWKHEPPGNGSPFIMGDVKYFAGKLYYSMLEEANKSKIVVLDPPTGKKQELTRGLPLEIYFSVELGRLQIHADTPTYIDLNDGKVSYMSDEERAYTQSGFTFTSSDAGWKLFTTNAFSEEQLPQTVYDQKSASLYRLDEVLKPYLMQNNLMQDAETMGITVFDVNTANQALMRVETYGKPTNPQAGIDTLFKESKYTVDIVYDLKTKGVQVIQKVKFSYNAAESIPVPVLFIHPEK